MAVPRLDIICPDDFHLHVRDGDSLPLLIPHAVSQFRRAIIMPNLRPPVRTASEALAYKKRIMQHVPKNFDFQPLMTLYLTDNTTPQDIIDAAETGEIFACKLYPAGATTNSDSGVTDIKAIYPTLRQMKKSGLLLLIHGEVTDPNVDIFDREAVCIDEVLTPLVNDMPGLKIVMEHITTENAVNFVLQSPSNVAATITAHHLMTNRNAIFQGGISAHLYCLPIIKDEYHRQALVRAATSGNPKFFAGTDSAPHEKDTKECCRGHAGIYTAFNGVGFYAQIFEQNKALDKLENFLSVYGSQFYGLPLNSERVVLKRSDWRVPRTFPYKGGKLVPFMSGDIAGWKCERTPKQNEFRSKM